MMNEIKQFTKDELDGAYAVGREIVSASEAAQVGQTILSQIRATDRWALGAWGTKQPMLRIEARPVLTRNLGPGVQFEVTNCPKLKRGRVVVGYDEGADLYNVVILKHTRRKIADFGGKAIYAPDVAEVAYREGLYAEDLVSFIDGVVG